MERRSSSLTLNVLLMGAGQSGRSSVGNALIGGEEFQTGACAPGGSVTAGCQRLSRRFRRYFRRQGAESDLVLGVVDTPPLLPSTHTVSELCPGGVHVLVLVLRADWPSERTHLREDAAALLGPEWRRHALLVLTHGDHLREAGLNPAAFLMQASDWLSALAEEVEGGVFFLDNTSDWPCVRGRPLRDRVLRLSARNHHEGLSVTESRRGR